MASPFYHTKQRRTVSPSILPAAGSSAFLFVFKISRVEIHIVQPAGNRHTILQNTAVKENESGGREDVGLILSSCRSGFLLARETNRRYNQKQSRRI